MRKELRGVFAGVALLLGIAAGGEAKAQIRFEDQGLTLNLTPTLSSDYLFRGVSQTRNRPAIQGTAELQHDSGFYVSAFASNIAFKSLDARQELDVLGGWRKTFDGFTVDTGAVWYTYPGYNKGTGGGLGLNYVELAAKLAYELEPIKALASFYYSPDFQLNSRNGYYLEGGLEAKLPYEATLAGRFGRQWIDRNTNFGLPDFNNWSVTLSRSFYGVLLTVGYFDTDIRRSACGGGQKICEGRAMVFASYTF